MSEFEIGKPGTSRASTKANLFSFGAGRNAYEKVFNPARGSSNDPEIPGPGQYTVRIYTMGTEGRKYKMQGRPKNI
jgi:hypothetical protein